MAGKSPEAFRTISEVADWLDRPAHVLRFWESKFPQVKPVKRAGGRRYYRPDDMLLLGGIKKLLHDDGMTIKGVQKIIREQGVKYVSGMSQALDDAALATESDSDAVDGVIATSQPLSYPAPAPDAGQGTAPAPTLQLVPDTAPPPAKAPAVAATPAPSAQDSTADAEQTPRAARGVDVTPADVTPAAPEPPSHTPPAADDTPAMDPVPQDAAPAAARAPLGADLPPPMDTDAIQTAPGLLALLAARSHPIPAGERDALTPILAQIDALTTRLVTARKG